jgi:HK97 family phage major capsid protein
MPYDKNNRETIGRIDDQMEAIVNRAKKDGRRGLTAEEQVRFNRMLTERDTAEEAVRRNERDGVATGAIDPFGNLVEIRDVFRMTPKQQRERMDGPHGTAFSSYLRRGLGAMDEDQRSLVVAGAVNGGQFQNAQSTTTGGQGGYTVPQGFSKMLEEALKYYGGILGNVEEFETSSGNPMPYPTVDDVGNQGRIIAQNVQLVETDLTFGQITFNAFIFSSDIVLVPLALLEDSYFDLDALLARLLGTRIGRLLNNKCTVGSGSGEPNGIVTAAVAAGNTNVFPTGETASIAYNDLVNIQHSVDPAYRNNPSSRWMFSDTLLKLLKKLVDGNNRPLWQPGLTASFATGEAVIGAGRPTILGNEYVINQDMAAPAANANSVLFGDMSKYKVRKIANGISVMRLVERYADYLQIGFVAWLRADGQLIDAGTHPLCVGVNSAT